MFVTLRRSSSRATRGRGVDWIGLVTFSGSLFLLVYALVQGNEKGWGSTEIVAMLVGAVVLLVLFLVAELAQRRPMLDLTLFRRPAFTGANIVAFCLAASFFAMFLYMTLYIQDVLHYSRCRPAFGSCRSRCCRSSSHRSRAVSACGCPSACCSAAACSWSASACCDDRA